MATSVSITSTYAGQFAGEYIGAVFNVTHWLTN